MRILSVESSSETASVAVVTEEGLLGEFNLNYKKQHSVLLMPMINELLKNLSLNIKDIDGFAVSKGPGSFTGLRIGMATVKGLSLGSDKPVIAISSLDALAFNIFSSSGIICSMMDALRNNVYCCIYRYEGDELKALTDYMAVSIDEISHKLKEFDEKVYLVGDGAVLHKEVLKKNIKNCSFSPNHINIPKASALGELGLKQLLKGSFDPLNQMAPIYLRKPQAEREYEKKLGISHE
ncbi:tRNA (adenosine(37)-N6)-threonylcarbamoyltransferase complex dimerization subunit type 1 TsaB [Clostridium polynesiense]|uniref:tRNA (adenosine(37)-N6)-threonylcarbamoyltransferase complex dimerization subunit type 1 TsaB n=1 Tax=Clostridium polynesiense TaxID=1325933 RepID=UPI0005911D0E|nr:tRNA (adenosine(37)-N6)-threonylcarbamoyltransferase complex dimerization subunit type 1 TsaB [Clostridium polynesiense]